MATNIGIKFEKFLSKLHNLKKIKASGALPFWKMDIEGHQLLLSAKATQAKSFRVTKEDLNELNEAVYGPGGRGGEYIPALIIGLVEGNEPSASDKRYFLIEESDFIRAFKEEKEFFQPSKAEQKLQTSKTPGLFRSD